jgi:undecaprenyl-diphosphatase
MNAWWLSAAALGLAILVWSVAVARAPYIRPTEARQRPGTSEVDAVLRGDDVPATGPSFPSGHVILVAAIGCVVAPHLRWSLWSVPLVLIALVMVGRVYVGAHNPLDVTAGLGAGLLVGGVVAVFVG